MGLFGLFAFMGFIEQKKELEDENKSLRDQLDNRPFFMPSTKRRKRKRRKKNEKIIDHGDLRGKYPKWMMVVWAIICFVEQFTFGLIQL